MDSLPHSSVRTLEGTSVHTPSASLPDTPEHALALAVLRQAVADLQDRTSYTRRASAQAFFRDADGPLAVWAQVLDVDAGALALRVAARWGAEPGRDELAGLPLFAQTQGRGR